MKRVRGIAAVVTLALCPLHLGCNMPAGSGGGGVVPGTPSPKLEAKEWLNGSAPDVTGKVVVLSAFASW